MASFYEHGNLPLVSTVWSFQLVVFLVLFKVKMAVTMTNIYPEDGESRLIQNVGTYLLHCVTSLQAVIFIVTAVRTPDFTC
jgi:hypothetical protein